MFNTNAVVKAVEKHGTVFFDMNLNPVVPDVGQWFCEYDDEWDLGESNFVRDGAIVEYLGPDDHVAWNSEAQEFTPYGDPMLRHLVATEYSDEPRRPQGRILILQA